jgi:hypothetical protein
MSIGSCSVLWAVRIARYRCERARPGYLHIVGTLSIVSLPRLDTSDQTTLSEPSRRHGTAREGSPCPSVAVPCGDCLATSWKGHPYIGSAAMSKNLPDANLHETNRNNGDVFHIFSCAQGTLSSITPVQRASDQTRMNGSIVSTAACRLGRVILVAVIDQCVYFCMAGARIADFVDGQGGIPP